MSHLKKGSDIYLTILPFTMSGHSFINHGGLSRKYFKYRESNNYKLSCHGSTDNLVLDSG